MALSRLGWPTLVMLLCCVAAAVAVSKAAEEEPLTKPIEHGPETHSIPGVLGEAPPLEAVVAEIMRLREQQGSDKLLESGLFEPLPLEAEIKDRKLQLSAAVHSRCGSSEPALCQIGLPQVSIEVADQIEALRQSAKSLDEAAHVLECHDRYVRADEVRELATQLRQDARTIRQSHVGNAEQSEETQEFSFHGSIMR